MYYYSLITLLRFLICIKQGRAVGRTKPQLDILVLVGKEEPGQVSKYITQQLCILVSLYLSVPHPIPSNILLN